MRGIVSATRLAVVNVAGIGMDSEGRASRIDGGCESL